MKLQTKHKINPQEGGWTTRPGYSQRRRAACVPIRQFSLNIHPCVFRILLLFFFFCLCWANTQQTPPLSPGLRTKSGETIQWAVVHHLLSKCLQFLKMWYLSICSVLKSPFKHIQRGNNVASFFWKQGLNNRVKCTPLKSTGNHVFGWFKQTWETSCWMRSFHITGSK